MPSLLQKISRNDSISFDSAKQLTREMVEESVLSRSVSDVEVGSFLSGGVDSSIISLCLAKQQSKPIKTFSIGFENESFDESAKARCVSELIKSEHHELVLRGDEISRDIDEVLLNYDEPFADPSSLPVHVLTKMASDHVKVALTGDGGDEVFGGYNKYYMENLNSLYTRCIPRKAHPHVRSCVSYLAKMKTDSRGPAFKLNKFMSAVSYSGQYVEGIVSLGFPQRELQNIVNEDFLDLATASSYAPEGTHGLHAFRNVDRALSLEGGLLPKVDRASMFNSVECRAPFLNEAIWGLTASLPETFLLQGWNKKRLLKEAFAGDFPKGFLEKSKKGFAVPVGDWLRDHLRDELLGFIEESFLEKQAIFKCGAVRRTVLDHLAQVRDETYRVWTFYCFQKWYVNNIE